MSGTKQGKKQVVRVCVDSIKVEGNTFRRNQILGEATDKGFQPVPEASKLAVTRGVLEAQVQAKRCEVVDLDLAAAEWKAQQDAVAARAEAKREQAVKTPEELEAERKAEEEAASKKAEEEAAAKKAEEEAASKKAEEEAAAKKAEEEAASKKAEEEAAAKKAEEEAAAKKAEEEAAAKKAEEEAAAKKAEEEAKKGSQAKK